jgi:FkbM family methyltransferase
MTIDAKRMYSRFFNRILCFMQQHDVRGKFALYQFLSKYQKNRVIRHRIDNRDYWVPVDEWCFWLEFGPENYYLDEMIPFCDLVNAQNQAFVFFDLGADIGTVSSLVAQRCPMLEQILAVEPNRSSYLLLKENLNQISVDSTALNCAVSDFSGRAHLVASSETTIDHEGYLDLSLPGETDVRTLDQICEEHEIGGEKLAVIKIDVEGQEIRAVKGATKLIRNTSKVIIMMEIHPDVLRKAGSSAEDIFREVDRIRPFRWQVPKLDNRIIDRTTPFFDQVPIRQYDLIGVSD